MNIRTFMAVTGPKTDLWLVTTVGAGVAAIGAVLAVWSGGEEDLAKSRIGRAGVEWEKRPPRP